MLLDPIAISIGPFAIRWYALAYVAGILLGWKYVGWLSKLRHPGECRDPEDASASSRKISRPWRLRWIPGQARDDAQPLLPPAAYDDIITYAVLGILLGGRIGYVLFYNLPYYLESPLEALKIWQGGMSFHGGLVGVITAFIMFCRKYKLRFFTVSDLLACATPIGLFFGRIANFINGELYGRVTDVPWGMVFPHGGPLPRHPSQLYEAGLEGLVLFVILFLLATRTNAREKTGVLSGVFLMGYAIARAVVENFREPDAQIGFLLGAFTMGQLLCVPMLLFGAWLVFRRR